MASDSNANPTPTTKPTFSLQDIGELKKVFDHFDCDHDGRISEAELAGVMANLGLQTSDDEIHRAMLDIDTDKDGFINLDEFAAFCRGGDDGGDKEVREAFDHYDKDKDGLISCSELHQVLNRLGESCSVDDCAKMISSVDTDRDGCVSFEEFKKMMANNKTT